MPGGRRKRTTLTDVALRAGVGTATVDRVLNERGNVSDDISKRVLQAARELGVRRMLPQIHRRVVRIDVILARPELPLIARIGFEFRRLSASLDRSVVIHRTVLDDEGPDTIARALGKTTCDAVISYMPDHPSVRAEINRLRGRGVPVVTVISDLPGSARIGYAGTNHYKAGRSAGYFLTRMGRRPGPVVILCNHLGFQSHADRVRGVSEFIGNEPAPWTIAQVVEGLDDRDRSELGLRAAFRAHPDAVAVYNVGAANIAVARAIRANLLRDRPIFVGHELTNNTVSFLREGLMSLAIDQNPELQVRKAVNLVLRHFSNDDQQRNPPAEAEVPTVLYGPENIPEPLQF